MSSETNAPTRTKSWFSIAAAALLIALFALAAACSSSDDDGDNGNGNGDDGSPTATAADGDDGDGDGDGNGSGDSIFDRIGELSDDYENIEARVVYDFTAREGPADEDGELFDTEMTLISRPPSDSRIEFQIEGVTIVNILTSDASYSCFSAEGLEYCSSGDGDTTSLPFFGDFTDVDEIRDIVDDEADVDIDEFDDNIAGEDVQCFRATGDLDGDDGDAVWCFTDDGVLLLASFAGTTLGVESTFEMRATDFSRDVSDSDFEPPYDELDIGDLGDFGDLFD